MQMVQTPSNSDFSLQHRHLGPNDFTADGLVLAGHKPLPGKKSLKKSLREMGAMT